jgi:hypothetical protein
VQNIVDLTGGYCAPYAYQICTDNANAGEELADPSMTNYSLTFYWVNPGTSESATFTYTDGNGNQPSATVNYTINGPTNIMVTNNPQVMAPVTVNAQAANSPTIYLELGYGLGNNTYDGITLQSAPVPSSGSLTWVQLITGDKIRLRADGIPYCSGGQTCTCNPSGLSASAAELDNVYPYVNGGNFNDSPRSPVNYSLGGTPINYNEVEQSFSATTYLLWDPALPLGCTPATTTGNGSSTTTKQSTCSGSIPIPLGNISWSWSGDGIDTEILQSSGTTQGTTFVLPCSPESEGSLGLTGGALPTMAEHCAVWHNI